jgi:hypothetical protein
MSILEMSAPVSAIRIDTKAERLFYQVCLQQQVFLRSAATEMNRTVHKSV